MTQEIEEGNLLLDTKQVPKLLNIGERTLWRYWNSVRVPKPIRIGGTLRWNAEKPRRWVETGCPTDEKWVS
jgi:prophage regulatory protein